MIETNINSFKHTMPYYSYLPNISENDIMSMTFCTNNSSSEHKLISVNRCNICFNNITWNEMINFTCKHECCIRCAGCIVSISHKCPICRAKIGISDIILNVEYIPSLFHAIKELIIEIINKENDEQKKNRNAKCYICKR